MQSSHSKHLTYDTRLASPTPLQRAHERTFFPKFLFLALLHVGLALLLYRWRPILPTLYVYTLVLVGILLLLRETPTRFTYLICYIASAEVLWRMTKADVFWETGKYLLVLLMALGTIRWRVKLNSLGIAYIILLIPGVILAATRLSPFDFRDQVSFNFSGPLSLGVAVAFMSGLRLNRKQVSTLLLIGILPVISVGTLAARSTLTAGNISFLIQSNPTTSGGFGPNQVSAVLGLGALYGVLYLLIARPRGLPWWAIFIISCMLLVQSVFTFSRGGLLNLLFAIPAALFFFARTGSKALGRTFILVLILSGLLAWTLPRLNSITSGALETRYEMLNTTGRAELANADIQTWRQNPIFGVGVGVTTFLHSSVFRAGSIVATHTEYSRLLAEHGLFGLAAILLLVIMVILSLRHASGGAAKGFAAGLMTWSLVEMTHAAMRIAAISFCFALPFAVQSLEDEAEE